MGNYNVERLNSIKRLMKQRKDNVALKEILSYMEDYPDDIYSKYQYGIIQKRLGNIKEAFNIFADVYEADQANKYSALFEMGKIKEIEREYGYAKFYFEKILRESPNSETFVSIELSKIERRLGNIDRAVEVLDEALKICPKETKKYIILDYAKLELLRKRKSSAQKILEEIPESQLTGKFRRKVLCVKGKIEVEYYNYEQALKYFEEVLEGEKDNVYWTSILEIAKIYEKQGRLNDSYEMCKRLKNNLNSFMGDVDLLLGKLYQRKGDFETAKECYLEAEKNKGAFIEKETQFRLGMLEKERLNLEDAKKYLNKATRTKNLYAAPAYLNLIYIAIREEDYKTCYELIDKLKELELNASMHRSINKIKVYLAHVTNKPLDHDRNLSYSEEQIINYSEEKALEHIIERHNSEQEEGDKLRLEDAEEAYDDAIDSIENYEEAVATANEA